MVTEDEREKLISLVKRQVKLLMEESVTKKYIHEDSSSILSLCAIVDACLSHGLKRRAIGLFRTNTTTALVQKLAKHYPPATRVINILNGIEQQNPTGSFGFCGRPQSTPSMAAAAASTTPATGNAASAIQAPNQGTSPLAGRGPGKAIVLGPTPPGSSNNSASKKRQTGSSKRSEIMCQPKQPSHDIAPAEGTTTAGACSLKKANTESYSPFSAVVRATPFYSSSNSSSSSPSPFSPSGGGGGGSSSSPGSPSPSARYQWIKVALFTQNLTAIIEQIYRENSTYYERTALMSDPLLGPLLVSLLVGPCALEYSRLKICEQTWSDAPADELLQRHKIHSSISAFQTRKGGTNSLKVNKNGNSSNIGLESTRCISSAKEYVESLHQNNKNVLIYGKNNVAVQPNGKNESYYGYLSLHKIGEERLLLKWTPNQIMNNSSSPSNTDSPITTSTTSASSLTTSQNSSNAPDKSALWEYALSIQLSDVVYIHCHQKSDSNDSIILVGHDGVQRPPLNFPKGNHLLTFLTCLETGMAPTLKLDPPLWNHRKKGKIFPRLALDDGDTCHADKVENGRVVELYTRDEGSNKSSSPKLRRQYLRSNKTADGNLFAGVVGKGFNDKAAASYSFDLRRTLFKGTTPKNVLPKSLDNSPEYMDIASTESTPNHTSLPERFGSGASKSEPKKHEEVDYVFRIAKVVVDKGLYGDGGASVPSAANPKGSDSPFWNFWNIHTQGGGAGGTGHKKGTDSEHSNRFVFPPTPEKNIEISETTEQHQVSHESPAGHGKFWMFCHINPSPTEAAKAGQLSRDSSIPIPPTPPPSPSITTNTASTDKNIASNGFTLPTVPELPRVVSNVAATTTPPWTKKSGYVIGDVESEFFDSGRYTNLANESAQHLPDQNAKQGIDAEMELARQSMNLLCQTMKKQILSRAFYGWYAYSKHLTTVRTHLADLVLPLEQSSNFSSSNPYNYRPEVHACEEQLKYGLTHHVYTLTRDSSGLKIINPELLLRAVYFGGIESDLRKEVWPYLLGYFDFSVTPNQKTIQQAESKKSFDRIITEWIELEIIIKERDKEILADHLLKMALQQEEKLNRFKNNATNGVKNSCNSLDTLEDNKRLDEQKGYGSNESDEKLKRGSLGSFTNLFRRLSTVSPFSRSSISSSSVHTASEISTIPSNTGSNDDDSQNSSIQDGGGNGSSQIEPTSGSTRTETAENQNALQQISRECQRLAISAQKSCESDNVSTVDQNHDIATIHGSEESSSTLEKIDSDPSLFRDPDAVLLEDGTIETAVDISQKVYISLQNGYCNSANNIDDHAMIKEEIDSQSSVDDSNIPPHVDPFNGEHSREKENDKDSDNQISPQQPKHHRFDKKIVEAFSLNIHRIDKDVLRCDRNYWYFADTKNLDKLRNVICSYVWTHLDHGYFQGMCDLAAPLLVVFNDEVLTYECFTRLMERMSANFPMGNGMDTNFANMRSLIQILDAEMYNLMQQNGDYTHFYFCYRWFLLDFKRELNYEDIFLVWETIWAARYVVSDQFVLFIALAFVEYYRGIILENNMDFTDIIKFFNEMAEKHPAKEILSVSRSLVQRLQCLLHKDD